MVNTKVMFQKSALSLTVIFLAMILGFVVINAGINFMLIGVEEYGVEVDDKYNKTFQELETSQGVLNSTIDNAKEKISAIQVEGGAFQTFWNSFKGVGAVLLIPLALIDVALDSISAFSTSLTILPPWSVAIIIMLIIVLIGLAIVAAMTGGNTNM